MLVRAENKDVRRAAVVAVADAGPGAVACGDEGGEGEEDGEDVEFRRHGGWLIGLRVFWGGRWDDEMGRRAEGRRDYICVGRSG